LFVADQWSGTRIAAIEDLLLERPVEGAAHFCIRPVR
jgi:hypothetical protein